MSETETTNTTNPKVELQRAEILKAQSDGKLATLKTYAKFSGPGWLQSAITLGGGSLASSLYLGVIGGFAMLWLQPFAMLLGIIMMSAIAYVTLSMGKRPLRAINAEISPVLGWGWLIASMLANIVWSMPQFALATAAIGQNLFEPFFKGFDEFTVKLIIAPIVLIITISVVSLYNAGGVGVKIFEILIKIMVGCVVLCFMGVVGLLIYSGAIDFGEIMRGFVPTISTLFEPSSTFAPFLDKLSESSREFWTAYIVEHQRDVMLAAAATAVGINMTFLLPYSMLRKGWDRDFRGLAIFDLSTGLFIPFILATGCVVIAAASQFHARPVVGLVTPAYAQDGTKIEPPKNLVREYEALLDMRAETILLAQNPKLKGEKTFEAELKKTRDALPEPEKMMASILVRRDAINLSDTLKPLVGDKVAKYVFGFGVLAMALNATTMLMLINGLCFCELLNKPAKGKIQMIGSLIVCVGILMPFFWEGALMYLAVPTSVFALVLLPIAYTCFFLMMNNKNILGKDVPAGKKRLLWNALMACSVLVSGSASFFVLWTKQGYFGLALFALFILAVILTHKRKRAAN